MQRSHYVVKPPGFLVVNEAHIIAEECTRGKGRRSSWSGKGLKKGKQVSKNTIVKNEKCTQNVF